MLESLAAAVGVATGLLGALKAIVDLFSQRLRQIPETSSGPAVLSLTTAGGEAPSARDVAVYVRTGYFVGALGLIYLLFGAAILTRLVDLQSTSWAIILIGGVLVLEGADFVHRASLRRDRTRVPAHKPVHEVVAQVAFSGDVQALTRVSLRALAAIGALRATGCHVRSDGDVVQIQGGTGAWPIQFRGQRITIRIERDDKVQRVSVTSASFWPERLQRMLNERNVGRLLEQLSA